LGAIKNSAQRLLNDKLEEPERKRNLELISRAVNNSSVLIQKFLNRSRNDTEENYAYFDDALTEWKSLFQMQYELMGIDIIEQLDKTDPVNFSQSELMQILNNLLSNAKDALNENEVLNREIIITTIQKDNYVELSVEDNGKGFDEETLKNAFEPFKTTKKQGEGTGLGLWIVKQILDQKGGSIEISNLKKGSIVKINLPIYYDKNGKELQSANS
jgi:signal transduction histidine kinase